MRKLTVGVLVSIVLLMAATFTVPAYGLPGTFWGVVPQSIPSLDRLRVLRTGGVDSIRVNLDWGSVQPTRSGGFSWASFDGILESATRSGLEVLPVASGAPEWAVPSAIVPGTAGDSRAPAHLPATGMAGARWSEFLRSAVARYGTAGSFWAENPDLPAQPIRNWQIWNEANFKYFVARPSPGEYAKLVSRSYAALRAVDPSARVVLGGLFGRPREGAWKGTPRQAYYAADFLEAMFRSSPGIASRFSAAALHPYSTSFHTLASEIEQVRAVLKEHGAGVAELWITELGWSAESRSRLNGFAKGPVGQARELKGAFTTLLENRLRWKLRRVYWFSVDDADRVCNFCGGSGLFSDGFKPRPAWNMYSRFAKGLLP